MKGLFVILGFAAAALGADEIAPGSCGDVAIFTSLPPRTEMKCRWAGGCGSTFPLAVAQGTVTSLKVTVAARGEPGRSLASASYGFRHGPARVVFGPEVCLAEGTLLAISYESEPDFGPKVAPLPIPR